VLLARRPHDYNLRRRSRSPGWPAVLAKRFHLPALRAMARAPKPVALWHPPHRSALKPPAARRVTGFSDFEKALLADPGIEAWWIATPPAAAL